MVWSGAMKAPWDTQWPSLGLKRAVLSRGPPPPLPDAHAHFCLSLYRSYNSPSLEFLGTYKV